MLVSGIQLIFEGAVITVDYSFIPILIPNLTEISCKHFGKKKKFF